ncbi:MAG: Asp-tRNA(Asn)/Glu-tRNA(Gln) amidotransferase subunit GatB [Verrucomicrobiota bacterium]
MKYEAVIGLEVHVQLKTASKMFCGCINEYGGDQNTHTCPICLGMPGALPTPNEKAIIHTIQSGLMLNCQIAPVCKFDRKNYFYPDMPKNYQTSQSDLPLCIGGHVTLHKYAFPKDVQKESLASEDKKIRINHIHLEEDVAKSTHYTDHSGIDYNRAGTPLMELVTEADLRHADEAFAFLTTLKQILIYGNVSDADMEKGQLRCDVNISIRPVGQEKFGTKCEIKNMNSISAVRRALKYEIDRQIDVVSSGGIIQQYTLGWSDDLGETFQMRKKEDSHDYRYFPCPDLLPIRTNEGLHQEAEKLIPELPDKKKERFMQDFQLTEYQAEVLASERPLADYYENAAQTAKNQAAVANFIINDFLATEPDFSDVSIPAKHFAELSNLVEGGKINSKGAKVIIAELLENPRSPEAIAKEKDLMQDLDPSVVENWCQEAIAGNAKSVEDFKSGKKAAINALKGYVMKQSRGKANPALVEEILLKKLS